jgi:hypothetical protein
MYAIDHLEIRPRPVPAASLPEPPAAILITLQTRAASPILAVDPRAGDAVARRLRQLHGRDRRVLAWAVLADRALCLLCSLGEAQDARLVSDLARRTTDDLAHLGHERVWRWPPGLLPVWPRNDLGQLVARVLSAPASLGLGWSWSGSCQWTDLEIAGVLPGLLWLDALTCDQDGVRARETD